jgi:microcystin-dependent protein
MINTCLPKVEQAVVNLAPDLADALLQLADLADSLLVDFVDKYGLDPGLEDTAITALNDTIRDLQTVVQELANSIDDPLDNLILVVTLNETISDPNIGPLVEAISNIVNVDPEILTALTELTESPIREYVSETIDNPIVPGGDIIDRTLSEIENNTDCVALNAIAQSNLEAIAELIEDITEHCGELAGSGAPGGGCDPLPLGLIIPYGGTPAVDTPKCYLPCDGASYSTTGDYKALFEVIGYNFGGSGSTFKVPDMRSRFPLGVSSSEVKEDSDYDSDSTIDDLVTDAAAASIGGKGGREKRNVNEAGDKFDDTVHGNLIINTGDSGTSTTTSVDGEQLTGTDLGTNDDVYRIKTLPPYLAVHYVIKAKK